MKLYKTTAQLPETDDSGEKYFTEFASSGAEASKSRTRLKKEGLIRIVTSEVEVGTTRGALIQFLNELGAHESYGTLD